MFQNIGMFLVSSYIVSPIAAVIDPNAGSLYYVSVFVLFALGCLLSILILFSFPNLRTTVSRPKAQMQEFESEE